MRLKIIGSLSVALAASTVFCLLSTWGNTPLISGDMCHTIKIAASRSGGRVATSCLIASNPPAEAPTTIIFLFSILYILPCCYQITVFSGGWITIHITINIGRDKMLLFIERKVKPKEQLCTKVTQLTRGCHDNSW